MAHSKENDIFVTENFGYISQLDESGHYPIVLLLWEIIAFKIQKYETCHCSRRVNAVVWRTCNMLIQMIIALSISIHSTVRQ